MSAPRRASASAMARPIPRGPPVTTATRPASARSASVVGGNAFNLDEQFFSAERRLNELEIERVEIQLLDDRHHGRGIVAVAEMHAQAAQPRERQREVALGAGLNQGGD